jgi:hypothetical protein
MDIDPLLLPADKPEPDLLFGRYSEMKKAVNTADPEESSRVKERYYEISYLI